MSQVILLISLLLVLHTTQSKKEVKKYSNEDAILECPVFDNDMDFFSFTWYKDQKPILRRRENQTYSSHGRNVQFGEKLSLFLPRVKPADSGTYMCGIKANVGKQNKAGNVFLTVNETELLTEPTAVTTTLNSTQSDLLCQVKDFPFMWSLAGYLTVALAKILLALFSIQVIQVTSLRRQKNRLRR